MPAVKLGLVDAHDKSAVESVSQHNKYDREDAFAMKIVVSS